MEFCVDVVVIVCLLFVVIEEGVFGVFWIGWYVWSYVDF